MARRGLLALVLLLWALAFARDRAEDWIAATDLPPLLQATATEVRDRNGVLLRAYQVEDGIWRMALGGDQVDPRFFDMLVAYEDRRFYRHSGVDALAVLRAAGQGLTAGRIVSGASTLTMQVARLLEDSGTGTWEGKLRQVRLALALERRLTKAQILQLYLGRAPYGGNVEGLRAASLVWFGKEPARLTPAQIALLVALPQSPEARRPDRHPQAARAARDRVLDRLVTAGALDAASAAAAKGEPVPATRRALPQLAPHLADRAAALGPGRHDLTLEAGLQARLEDLAATYMAGRDPGLSLALIVADHQTGEILASLGSARYAEQGQGFVDMTRARRSPGSTLKPLIYGLAFDRGLAHPETLISDTPAQFGTWAPQNFDGAFRGDIRVAEALQLSLNIPVVRLTEALGPAHVMAALQGAGLAPDLAGGRAGLAISLGGIGLTPEEMVTLYAALAQGGQARPLRWQRHAAPAAATPLMAPRAAWMVGHVLAGLPPPPQAGPPGRVAYKTGTSYGHRDAWALGWDGRHVAGVWIGRPDGTPVPGAFGGDLAAPLLFEALGRLHPTPLPPPPPDTLLLANADLPPHLQRFGPRAEAEPLRLTFPPDGARLAATPQGVPVKLRGGTPPYTLLADGAPLLTGQRSPEFLAPLSGPGFTTLSVIDAEGRSGRVRIDLR
ncbi:penicillin-binding protein 1C [Salipiger marinus]|uniref:penicillin-binding protein 1C n=1 Tax=Salipiger marinus TaxID=555512 RepID=UPI0040585D14